MSARARTAPGRARDEGGATVLACVAVAALLALTLLTGQVGAVIAARHRAQSVADLGALAAAGALDSGTGCERAEEIARRMRARVLECDVAGWDVTVRVEASVVAGPLAARPVRAAARAGPVDTNES
ncbi:Rv3654c family TadE-like protein [Nocardia sp. NPDC004068]|uniref:Rv3654c family TadE-like protein n=1 Tax=Nocardia sp. NPDC004068 TaxID=3364303 RepID=UPI0036B235E9